MGKKLTDALAKLQKTYKMEIKPAREACEIERIQLDSPGLNYIFGGGFALGRIYELSGPESGGKSTLSTYIASQIQKHYTGKNTVLYVDFEYAFDVDHAETLGLDVDNNFIIIRPLTGEEGFEMMKDIVNTGEVGLVVLDSITTMSTKSQVEDANKANFGAQAKVLSNGLRDINPYLYTNKCSMIMISQERDNVGAMWGPDFKTTGGRAPAFYASWRARLTRVEDITEKDKGLVGIKIKVRNTKNKVGIPKREAIMNLNFYNGINSDDEYLDYLVNLNLVERKGPYYSNDAWGMKVLGMNGVAEFLHNNPTLYENVKKEINNLIAGYTVLDEAATGDDAFEAYGEEMAEREENSN